MEEIAANGINIRRFLACKAQNNGNIMGRKGPKDVFLSSDFPKAQTARINILKSSDLPIFNHLLQPDDGSMIMKDMADKKDFLAIRSQSNQFFTIRAIKGQGLFHEDVLADVEDFFCNVIVKGGRGGDDNAFDICVFENHADVIGNGNIRIGFGHFLTNGLCSIANRFENAQLMKIAHEIFAPVSGADDGNMSLIIHGSKDS